MDEEQKQQEIMDACIGLTGDELKKLEREGLLAENVEGNSNDYVKKSI